MTDWFEDHCWRDVIPAEVQALYRHYRRDIRLGARPALLAIDLYELVYQGGDAPVEEVSRTYPSACGEQAWAAIAPTMRLFAASREAELPIFYTTADTGTDAAPGRLAATNRQGPRPDPALFAIRSEFQPQPGDTVVRKQRASAFFGTPLAAQLTQCDVRTVIICGESTSGCVRASAVDAYSHGFEVVVVEECCFDRAVLMHKVSLFDLHHKYAAVMHEADVVRQLAAVA